MLNIFIACRGWLVCLSRSENLVCLAMVDSHCPVCLRIYIEPVLFPCDHCVCKPCFDGIITKANLQCPLCRRRLGSWARLSARNGSLVNLERWEYIQKHFKKEVQARLSGKSTPKKSQESAMREQFSVVLSNSGEIRQEYEMELHKIQEERLEQDKASHKLIKEILAKEEKELAAFRAANKENKPADSTQSVRLPLPRRSSSIDSITGEYNRHFKPIVRYPRTPPRPANKDKGYPETIKVTPCPQTVKRLDFASSCTPPEAATSTSDLSSSKPGGSTANSLVAPFISSTKDVIDSYSSASAASGVISDVKKSDHTFLLPLHTNFNADEQSNDGLSVVSSSTSTSLSTSRLKIETTSPVIPLMSPWGSNATSTETISRNSRNGANSDTVSYRSDTSSPPARKRQCGRPKKNGYLNTKSSSAKTLASAPMNGNIDANGVGPVITNENGEINGCPGSRAGTSKSVSRSSSKSAASSSNPGRSAVKRRRSVLSSYTSDDLEIDGEDEAQTNGYPLGPAFVDRDEEYARKLQEMYRLEDRYKLTALRFKGSGNEYNTRKRRKTTHT